MQNRQMRTLFLALGVLVGVWLLVWAGFSFSSESKMTEERIHAYVLSVDFGKLSAGERTNAIQTLSAKLSDLSHDERLRLRGLQEWRPWVTEMTAAEKRQFVGVVLPADVDQTINAFELMPLERRRRIFDEAVKSVTKAVGQAGSQTAGDTNTPAYSDPQLQKQIQLIGLKTFFYGSPPETKIDLGPLLEEVQNQLQNGRPFR